jgi:hypothetical protein
VYVGEEKKFLEYLDKNMQKFQTKTREYKKFDISVLEYRM